MNLKLLSKYFLNDTKPAVPMTKEQRSARDQVIEKIKKEIYRFEQIDCPYCKKNNYIELSAKDAYGLPVGVVLCKGCQFIYTNPRFCLEALSAFYNTEYRQIERGSKIPQDDYFQLQLNKGKAIYDYLKTNLVLAEKIFKYPEKNWVIEIGCGAGGILEFFRRQGFNVMGCDWGEEYLAYGIQKNRLELYPGSIEVLVPALKKHKAKVGIVLYEQTFEHVFNIKEELEKLKLVMDDDSFLFIGVPGLKNIDQHYDSNFLHYIQPGHLWHFDLHNLVRTLKNYGFSLVSGDETIKSIFSLSPAFNTGQKETQEIDLLDFLRSVERRRQLKNIKNAPRKILLWLIKPIMPILRLLKKYFIKGK